MNHTFFIHFSKEFGCKFNISAVRCRGYIDCDNGYLDCDILFSFLQQLILLLIKRLQDTLQEVE